MNIWGRKKAPKTVIERISVIGIREGDVVVVHLGSNVTREEGFRFAKDWHERVDIPSEVMFTNAVGWIEVLRPESVPLPPPAVSHAV